MKTELTSVATSATTGGIIILQFKYFIFFYMFVEWIVLLHDCYTLWARPIWRFISTTQPTRCAPTQAHNTNKVCNSENGGKKSLRVDLKIIMGKLGMFWDHNLERRIIGLEETIGLFDEDEPSLEEVKEAFSVFDINKDGYIDEKELKYMFSKMGYFQIPESNCRQMIHRYDVDKDMKISFREFMKIMEDCF